MLIDKCTSSFIDDLSQRACGDERYFQYLLIDGAFLGGIHKIFRDEEKRLLFDGLLSRTDEVRNVSPFLLRLDLRDRRQRVLLHRSSGWPMVSIIQTPEGLTEVFTRLAAWCVIEVGRDRFNFRFSDTRRLPAIVENLTPVQRSHFLGPVIRWSYVARDGNLVDLDLDEREPAPAGLEFRPVLQESQFAALLDDGRADEILAAMQYRGEDVECTHYQRWASAMAAISIANASKLGGLNSIEWVIWHVRNHHGSDAPIADVFKKWLQSHEQSTHSVIYTDLDAFK